MSMNLGNDFYVEQGSLVTVRFKAPYDVGGAKLREYTGRLYSWDIGKSPPGEDDIVCLSDPNRKNSPNIKIPFGAIDSLENLQSSGEWYSR